MDKIDFLTEMLISDFPLMKAAKVLILLKLDHRDVYNEILETLGLSDNEIETVINAIIWMAGKYIKEMQQDELFNKGPSQN